MIGFYGLSHLGTNTSVGLASRGFKVVAYDRDADLVARMTKHDPIIHEPSLRELLDKHGENISFSSDVTGLRGCKLVYLAIDVPTNAGNESDLAPIEQAIEHLATNLQDGTVLVIHSQVPPGFTRKMQGKHPHIEFVYQVETLIFGRALERVLEPERYIIGISDRNKPIPSCLAEVLEPFGCPIFPMNYESAELAKISINLFLCATVSTTNTLATICEQMGATWSDIEATLRLDQRIGKYAYLQPGLGISGGNLERDMVTTQKLAEKWGAPSEVVDSWLTHSRFQANWPVRKFFSEVAQNASRPVVALWGLAYKPKTHSVKNSRAIHFVNSLPEFAIRAYDPEVKSCSAANVSVTGTAMEALEGADCLFILTPWDEFHVKELEDMVNIMQGKVIVDPFGCLDGERCRSLGVSYHSLGEQPEASK